MKLQVFASDVDQDAITSAREGLYPETIAANVSPARLARFFTKEDHGYRVLPELRASVVFTVQDVLADPPFSRIDMVSCRNLLIYLRPDAQTKAIAAFHFALRDGGVLLLGSSESVGEGAAGFDVISKSNRIYRHVGHSRPGEFGLSRGLGDSVRVPARPGYAQAPSRQAVFAELCRRRVLETYAPAAVLIDRKQECLYFLGATDRYLRVAPGHPSHDLLSMAPESLRIKLRAAIQQARQTNARVTVAGGRAGLGDAATMFSIDIQPIVNAGEELLLICFVDRPQPEPRRARHDGPADTARVTELEEELAATRTELQGAIRNLEISAEEQKAVNEEALSVNEEFQSTNEELLTSKEELQSLNEELTALNSQLQETLERQRTTSNDLQNVLFSTDVATLFLDTELKIRFFTPATRSLFSVIPGDIGRPLADLHSLAADRALAGDARAVISNQAPLDREIETQGGRWFTRRILPYRTGDGGVEGVVITFTDITERNQTATALEAAKQLAERANASKSRFLAAASHDLRQPLQTMVLLQSILAKSVQGTKSSQLVARLDEALKSMSSMLNTLLDINQIETGATHPEITSFPVNALLDSLRDNFAYHAQARGLRLRVVPCGLVIRSDRHLLEQMIRNLLSNALKFTDGGKILLGCRRHAKTISIVVADTGLGIPETEFEAIFEEYHQVSNEARERGRGLGLGLSIVRRVGQLLGHPVRLHSVLGRGSVFAVEVERSPGQSGAPQDAHSRKPEWTAPGAMALGAGDAGPDEATSGLMLVEDDPDLRALLDMLLQEAGHRTTTAANGPAALDLVRQGTSRPDLILVDFDLPGGLDGLELVALMREALHREVPAIILTGDVTASLVHDIESRGCVKLTKPVTVAALTNTIDRMLARQAAGAQSIPAMARQADPPPAVDRHPVASVIFVVDDENDVREALRGVLELEGWTVETFVSCEAFLAALHPAESACALIDAYLPGMSGLELLGRLREVGHGLPAIMITGNSDVPIAVQAMKAGAFDFIEKPVGSAQLLATVRRALEQSRDSSALNALRESAVTHIGELTARQRQIMDMVLAGHPSKNIAADLGISQRTVENHRASIMKKTGTKSIPALARMALAASDSGAERPRETADDKGQPPSDPASDTNRRKQ